MTTGGGAGGAGRGAGVDVVVVVGRHRYFDKAGQALSHHPTRDGRGRVECGRFAVATAEGERQSGVEQRAGQAQGVRGAVELGKSGGPDGDGCGVLGRGCGCGSKFVFRVVLGNWVLWAGPPQVRSARR